MADRPSNIKASNKKLIGFAFPFQKKNGRFPYTVEDAELVKNDLFALFSTPQNSRVMRPNLGTNAEELVFESQGDLLRVRLERSIRQTIASYEPRIAVLELTFQDVGTQTIVDVEYTFQGVRDNLTIGIENPSFG